ncbi:uncharacterized protein SPPG_09001 [Spizellomyces punctatus DAOM BR117]|uniref:MAPEG family protein n=1 Tax=Spizellomyces punctatus (strain DAOM BR117) TaxID=645134 RepID=A0A0L0HQD2_SPIPD|nr:uncharacterized protein SPPG_09001 [Spizellomyces punctatus DAOM BR117]KND03160.1 hypothetical protein SPPG_09001 [Spizellomyces punctatus DAOM BR117]|eukprot:XP_016611199.1 hypothetical protein SPPG_09001 [Spizellomyces punctatus DAOM BR117]
MTKNRTKESVRQTNNRHSSFHGYQLAVIAQVILAAIFSYTFILQTDHHFSAPSPTCGQWPLLHAFRLLPLSAIPLLLGVFLVGILRFLTPAIDPTVSPIGRNHTMDVFQRYLQNTVEQFMLHFGAVTGLAAWDDCKHVLPLVMLFVIARVIFLLGYLATSDGRYRGVGFAMTVWPTVWALGRCLLYILKFAWRRD